MAISFVMEWEVVVISIFVIVFVGILLHRRVWSLDKASTPIPPSLPLLGHLHLLKKPLHRSLAALSARHGPVLSLRFGSRPVLLVSSAAAAEECFSKNDLAFAGRPRLLAGKHLGYDYTTMLWAPHGAHWRSLRRIATAEIFSSSRLESSASIRMEEVAAMVKAVADDSHRAGAVELRPRLFELNLSLMMRLTAGKRFSGEKKEERSHIFQAIVEESFAVSDATHLADFLPALRWVDYEGFGKKLLRLHKKRDALLQELVDDRREMSAVAGEVGEEKHWRCLIDELLCLQKGDPEQYRDEIIKGLTMTLLSAGTDTTALTVEWALALLLTDRATMAEARAEIDQHVGRDRLLNESDLPNLTHLQCIIKEAQRLHPVTPIIPAHESMEECTVGGFRVARGTMLLVNVWAIQRDTDHWDDPGVFQPERWGEGVGDKGLGKTFYFGMGRRRCPGEGLALRMVGLTLGTLVQCFDWAADDGGIDLGEGTGLSMPMAKPLRALCKERPFLKDILVA